MTKIIQQTTVKGLFERNGSILLVKDHKGVWELPGGRIEDREKPHEALKRELNEELGLNEVRIGKKIHTWSFESENDGNAYSFTVLVFICNTSEEEIKEHDEYTEYRWIPISEIDSLNMRDGYKKSINLFLREIQ
jgi:8-oxo-dGTP diphosphatase